MRPFNQTGHGTPDSGTGRATVDAVDMDGQSIDSGRAHAPSHGRTARGRSAHCHLLLVPDKKSYETDSMGTIFQFFDRITAAIPPNLVRAIRLGTIVFWVGLAIAISIYSWRYGVEHAPRMGQDLYLAEIKEKIQKDKNLDQRAPVTVENLNDILTEGDQAQIPEVQGRIREGLDSHLETAEPAPSSFPPFLGSKKALVYPEQGYRPSRDEGVAGGRSSSEEPGINILPMSPEEKEPARAPLNSPENGKKAQKTERRNAGSSSEQRLFPVE